MLLHAGEVRNTSKKYTYNFMEQTSIEQILNFLHLVNRAHSVKLVLPETRIEVGQEQLEMTLEDMGMCPRAVVIASIYSEDDRQRLLASRHVQAVISTTTVPAEQIKNIRRWVAFSIMDVQRHHQYTTFQFSFVGTKSWSERPWRSSGRERCKRSRTIGPAFSACVSCVLARSLPCFLDW